MVCPRLPCIWGQIQLRLLLAAGRPATLKQALPKAWDTGMKKEERFGVEGSDVQSAGGAGPGPGLLLGVTQLSCTWSCHWGTLGGG